MSISPDDIKRQLRRYLPTLTELFTESIVGTATASGNIVTVNSTGHSLIVGQNVNLYAGDVQNHLGAVEDLGDDIARFTTDFDHDLTFPKAINDPKNLTLDGFGDTWDDSHVMVSIPNRRTFDIRFPSGITVLPTLTADTFLVESRPAGMQGIFPILAVIDADNFTVDVTGVPSFPTGPIKDVKIATRVRIYAASNFEKAEAAYTKLGIEELALFLIMSDVDVSKDRDTYNDAVGGFLRSDFGKQTFLQNFTTIVFFPISKNDKTGSRAQQLAYQDVFIALYSTLFGVDIKDPLTSIKYVIVSNGHGPARTENPYYVHSYEWQLPAAFTFDVGFNQQADVAFRDISSTFDLLDDDQSQLDLNMDLDDVPLP